jgi:hypothetical protein
VCCRAGVVRWFQGLLGANTTSTALASAREILAPKLSTNGAKVGSADPLVRPNQACLVVAFDKWACGLLGLVFLESLKDRNGEPERGGVNGSR